MKVNSLAAVIVTFNRLKLLKECILTLRLQSYKLDAIIIIDNGSTDETSKWLSGERDLIVIYQENLGGAGGFARGLSEANDRGYEWVWIMDDDSFPERKCLEYLVTFLEKTANNSNIHAVAPLVVEGNCIDERHRGNFSKSDINFPQIQVPLSNESILNLRSNFIIVEFISFVGLLLNRRIINVIGLPVANYFIFNDDVEYSLRIKSAGFKMALLTETCIYHKINQNPDEFNLNKFAKKREALDPKVRSLLDINLFQYYGYRNSIINVLKYYQVANFKVIFVIIKKLLALLYTSLRFGNRVFIRVKLFYETVYQGFTGRIDNKRIRDLYEYLNR